MRALKKESKKKAVVRMVKHFKADPIKFWRSIKARQERSQEINIEHSKLKLHYERLLNETNESAAHIAFNDKIRSEVDDHIP